jgi:hypothetical protein
MRYAWGALMINQFGAAAPAARAAKDPAAALAAALQPGADPLAYFQLKGHSAWEFFGWLCLALPVLLAANVAAGRLLIHYSKK